MVVEQLANAAGRRHRAGRPGDRRLSSDPAQRDRKLARSAPTTIRGRPPSGSSTEACDAIKATIKTGKVDFGGSWLVGDRQFTLVVGCLHQRARRPGKGLQRPGGRSPTRIRTFRPVKFDVVTDGDVRFHTWTSPVPADDKVNRAIGKELKVAVGFGPQERLLRRGNRRSACR